MSKAVAGQLMQVLEPISQNLLTVGEEIGKGRFKRVHRGRHKRHDVVILRYAKEESNTNELRILVQLAKPGSSAYVPEIFGVCHERDMILVVQEIAAWGALKGVLKSPNLARSVTPMHKLYCALQITRAMAFLESEHIVHADLSCRNVLVFRLDEEEPGQSVVKVTDFGLSVILAEGTDCEYRKQPQATRWCAPETILRAQLSHRSDVWSLGALLWELFARGLAPWTMREKRADVAARLRDLAESAEDTDVSEDFPLPAGCPPIAHEAVLSCLLADEHARPTFSMLSGTIATIIGDFEDDGDKAPGGTPILSTAAPPSPEDTPRAASTSTETKMEWPEDDAFARFKMLKAFLKSRHAIDVVGHEMVCAMAHEVEEAQARETYLLDLVRRLQDQASSMQGVFPGTLSGSPSQERLPDRVTTRDMWTLWSMGTALWRQDFASEADAWAAFDANRAYPCMLRDPSGAEAAARSWVASYIKLAPPRACEW